MPGQWEWLIILFIILLLFGAKKLPELAKSLGKGIQEFKKASKDVQNIQEDLKDTIDQDPAISDSKKD